MWKPRALLVALAVPLLWGCGGAGSPATSSPNPLVDGRNALNRVASGDEEASAQRLQSILDLFGQALRQDPASAEAHFGIAVCLMGAVGLSIDDPGAPPPAPPADGVVVPALPTGAIPPAPTSSMPGPGDSADGGLPPAPPGHGGGTRPVPPPHRLGLIWNLDQGLTNPYLLLRMLVPALGFGFGLSPGVEPGFDDARRQRMLEGLTVVAAHLDEAEKDPSFSVALPDANAQGQTVTIGIPEVRLFDAYVQSLRVQLALSLAYVRDGGAATLPWGGEFDPNHDGRLVPSEYLPPDPYLRLRDAAYLRVARDAMLAAADEEEKGIQGALARTGDMRYLIPNTPEFREALQEALRTVVPLIRQTATGPVTLDFPGAVVMAGVGMSGIAEAGGAGTVTTGEGGSPGRPMPEPGPMPGPGPMPEPGPPYQPVRITIDLSAWFGSPPPDLRAFAPTLVYSGGDGEPLSFRAEYPDPTFGGLFPQGLPALPWL